MPCELQVGKKATAMHAISYSSEWTTVSSAIASVLKQCHNCPMKVAPSWSHPLGKKEKRRFPQQSILPRKLILSGHNSPVTHKEVPYGMTNRTDTQL